MLKIKLYLLLSRIFPCFRKKMRKTLENQINTNINQYLRSFENVNMFQISQGNLLWETNKKTFRFSITYLMTQIESSIELIWTDNQLSFSIEILDNKRMFDEIITITDFYKYLKDIPNGQIIQSFRDFERLSRNS